MSSDEAAVKNKFSTAMGIVCGDFPYMAGLAAAVDVRLDNRIKTAAVTPSGKILIGTEFYADLSLLDLAIILAHELFHLFRDTINRAEKHRNFNLVNIADDYMINDIIRQQFNYPQNTILDIGLNWQDFRSDYCNINNNFVEISEYAEDYSLEEVVVILSKNTDSIPSQLWKLPEKTIIIKKEKTAMEDALIKAGIATQDARQTTEQPDNSGDFQPDILTQEMERALFPDEDPSLLDKQIFEIQEIAKNAAAESVYISQLKESIDIYAGYGSSGSTGFWNMLKGHYKTPWEAALQRWFDAVAPGDRTWARPSRRGAYRTDVVLPGRKREGWILHLVLDTSGSMYNNLSKALAAIAQFCANNNVDTVRVIQADATVQKEEFVTPEDLENSFQIVGLGGTDFDSTFAYLSEDPDIESVVILSDGYFSPPPEPPFNVLWAITGNYQPNFPYGTRINMDTLP